MAEKETYEYEVTSRFETVDYQRIRQPIPVVMVTYVYDGLAPHTVRIPKAEWSMEAEGPIIRASIVSRLKEQAEVHRV